MIGHPQGLSYSTRHLWVRIERAEHTATVGVTEELAEQLGKILSVDMPMVGDELDMESFCIHLHLANRIHHLRSPLTGRVLEINREVLDSAGLLHISPYDNWLYRMEFDDPEELHLLMSPEQYTRFLDNL